MSAQDSHPSEGLPNAGHPPAGITFFTVVITSLITLISIIFLQGVYYHTANRLQEAKEGQGSSATAAYKAEQARRLSGYQLLDAKTGRARIPVDAASQKVYGFAPARPVTPNRAPSGN